jgi:tetratricopeptide (TPR) repeat protein
VAQRNSLQEKIGPGLILLKIKGLMLATCFFLIISAGLSISLAAETDGIIFFQQEKYSEAASCLATDLKNQPDNSSVNFYMGRSLLALNQPADAVFYLRKATVLDPVNADYHFWLGVGHWATTDFEEERRSYLEALKLNPKHLSANLYLGHSYVDQGDWQKALIQYDRVLGIDADFPEALYNRAVALGKLNKTPEAREAWKRYLSRYHFGTWAFQAVDQLNQTGDFSFRAYWLGSLRVIMPKIAFATGTDGLAGQSIGALETVKKALERNSELSLHIVAYVKGNAKLAASRAKALKANILKSNPDILSSRVKVSWFDEPEKISSGDKMYVLNESVNFITAIN